MHEAIILTPVYNDWDSLRHLLRDLDATFESASLGGRVIVVDDGSTTAVPDALRGEAYARLSRVELIRLKRNLGHQRAIAVGLAHLANSHIESAVIVMDGDGEDKPTDIPTLLTRLAQAGGRYHVVFAARAKRFEGLAFRLMYDVYRLLHWLLTGIAVRVGNYSALTPSSVKRLALDSNTWNHYAAAVFHSRIPYTTVPLARGRRYGGSSHMRYSGLVAHGLSAVAVFSEIVAARLIVLFAALVIASVTAFGVIVGVRLYSGLAIPGWATNAGGIVILFAMQSVMSLLILVLLVLGDRSQARIIPARDAVLFVDEIELLTRPSA